MAHRYLCPICDQELTGLHYCKVCRKWIKEPVIFHGDSLPNESSHRNYANGMAGRSQRQTDMRSYNESYGRPGKSLPYDKCHPGQSTARRTAPQKNPYRETNRQPNSYGSSGRSGRNAGSAVFLVVMIWFVIVFLISFLGILF